MALYLTHPSSMVGRIVHKGDVFVVGNKPYTADDYNQLFND